MKSSIRSVSAALGVFAGLVLVAVVGVLMVGSGSTETEVFPEVTLGDPPDLGTSGPSQAIVIAKNTTKGTVLFGLPFGRTTYRLRVQFYTSPGCWPQIDFGDRWPAPFDECSSDIEVEGEVSGLGTAPTGHSIVGVDVEVPHECFDAVSAGDSWPTDITACFSNSSDE